MNHSDMALTLKSRLVRFMQKRHTAWIPSGELQRIVAERTSYSPANVTRRLRECVEDGSLKVKYVKNHAHYRFLSSEKALDMVAAPKEIPIAVVNQSAEIIADPMAPVLNGLQGTIWDITEFKGRPLYRLLATNDGPYLKMDGGGTKKIMAWKKGDIRSVHREALKVL